MLEERAKFIVLGVVMICLGSAHYTKNRWILSLLSFIIGGFVLWYGLV